MRVVRDLFTDEEFKALVTDSPRVYDKVMDYVRDVAPDLAPKVSLHEGKLPAFEEHHDRRADPQGARPQGVAALAAATSSSSAPRP